MIAAVGVKGSVAPTFSPVYYLDACGLFFVPDSSQL